MTPSVTEHQRLSFEGPSAILIVDDLAGNARLLQAALRSDGYEFHVVSDGQ